MDRLIATNSVPAASADTAPAAGTPQFATNGNPVTNTPATQFPAYQYNAIQEELIAIIDAAAIAPDRANNAQVLAAIRALIASSQINPVKSSRSNLAIVNDGASPNTKRNVTADELVLENPTSGATVRLQAVNVSINSGVVGAGGLDAGALAANTPYYEFVIWDPVTTTAAGLMSLSRTAPTLPAGYTMFARVGCGAITDAAKNFYRLNEANGRGQFVVTPATNTATLPIVASGAVGTWSLTAPTWATVSLSALLAASVSQVRASVANCYNTGGSGAQGAIAPNANYGGPNSANPPPVAVGNIAGQDDIKTCDLMLEALSLEASGNGAGFAVMVLGFTDNL